MNTQLLQHTVIRFLLEVLKLAFFAVVGIFLYALVFQLLVAGGGVSADMDGEGYGRALTTQAVYVWVGALVLGLVATFFKGSWRWPLLAAPAYAPALYALMAGFLA